MTENVFASHGTSVPVVRKRTLNFSQKSSIFSEFFQELCQKTCIMQCLNKRLLFDILGIGMISSEIQVGVQKIYFVALLNIKPTSERIIMVVAKARES